MREERDWPEMVVSYLQLLAQVFANALSRKRADEALRKSEERLNLAADAARNRSLEPGHCHKPSLEFGGQLQVAGTRQERQPDR